MLFSFIESLQELMNTDLITYGGTTITIGAIIIAIIRMALPNAKSNKENAGEIARLKKLNEELSALVEDNQNKIKELESVIKQIIEISTNKKIRCLKLTKNTQLHDIGEEIKELKPLVEEVVKNIKKVKVKKGKK